MAGTDVSQPTETSAPGSVASPARCLEVNVLPPPEGPRSQRTSPGLSANEIESLQKGQLGPVRLMSTLISTPVSQEGISDTTIGYVGTLLKEKSWFVCTVPK